MAKTLQHQSIEGALHLIAEEEHLDPLFHGAKQRRISVLSLGPCRRAFLRGRRFVARRL